MAQRKNVRSQAKKDTPPAPAAVGKNGKKSEGSSVFSWIFILALLGAWTAIGVVWFDIVDYDTVIGTLSPYDVDGDGRLGFEDAKVLLGLSSDGDALAEDGLLHSLSLFLSVNTGVAKQRVEDGGVTLAKKGAERMTKNLGRKLKAALKEQLRIIHEKIEAKKIAKMALSEVRTILAKEEEERLAARALELKTQETAKKEKELVKAEKDKVAKVQAEKEKEEKERVEKDKSEKERVAKENAEKERLAKEKAEEERLAKEQAEKERLEKEKAEKERLAKEQADKERLAKEKAEKERLAKEQAEKERLAKEKAEKERLAKEQAEKERLAKEKAEKERLAKEQAEKERLAKEKAEKERLAKEEAEKERLAKEKAEKERLAKEEAEKERLAKEKAEKERLAKEQAEKERLAKEKAEKERLAKEKAEKERLAKEKAEKERLAKEQAEKERLAKEKAEKERLAKEQAEKERLAKEKAEKERLAKEQAEKERLAKEKAEKERLAKEQAEKERLAKEKAEKERLAKEKAEKERLVKEQAEKERIAKEKAEKERLAKEQAEKERLAKEKAEKERLAKEQAEKERTAKEKAEKERLAKEQAEKERLAKEKAEKERLAKEQAEKERLAKEKAEKEKLAKEKAEKERIAKEKAEKEKQAKEQAEKERLVKEKAEKERLAKEKERLAKKAESEKMIKEQAEKEKLAKKQTEKEKSEKEKLVKEKVVNEKAEKDKSAEEKVGKKADKDKTEKEVTTKEKKGKDKVEKEKVDTGKEEKNKLDKNKEDHKGNGNRGRAAKEEKISVRLKEKPTARETSQHIPVTDTSSERKVRSDLETEAEQGEETEFINTASSYEDSFNIDQDLTAAAASSHLEQEFTPFDPSETNFDSFAQDEENLNTIDSTGELVVDSPPEDTGHSDSTVLYSEQFGDQQTEEADPHAAESAQDEVDTTLSPELPEESISAESKQEESTVNTESIPTMSEPAAQSEPPRSEPEEPADTEQTQESTAESKSETPESPAPSEPPQDNTQPNTAEEATGKKKKPKMLNKFDKTIKAELDAAEKLRKKGKVEEALKAFEGLVQKHPHSPRSHYGKAQSEDDLAEKLRSNEMLLKAVNSYKEAAELPDAPAGLVKAALKRRADRQQFLGRMRGSLATLQLLVQTFPEDIALKNDLGVAHLLLGDNKAAKTVYEEVLAKAPSDGFAKVHYGFILKSENQIAESIPYLREGLESGAAGTDDGRFYFHLGDALQRVGDQSAYEWYERGHKQGHFASVWQRSLYNVKGLRAQPWWTARETGYTDLVKTLERNWMTIRDEALSVMNASSGLFVAEDENLREKGDWGQFTLWQQGRKAAAACRSVPKTCALMERYPEATGCKRGQIKFSVMHPGTHVWPHTGPTNCRLRMHLGLVIPPEGCRIRCTDQIRSWEEGKVLIFDDSFEHEVWQEADRYRLIFIVDVWHPELSQTQRQTLSPI
ncbi:hypothetical protein ACEWY4_018614 [Coilia grayii]|uniref:Aspartyl/asparaginyl beta-hydroxylase n=1 Tax=Coilia grayii TaxID=363190 RepID=A0ABD1JDQ8_9TELE